MINGKDDSRRMRDKLPNIIAIEQDGMTSHIQLITMMAMYNQKCHKKSLLKQFCELMKTIYPEENIRRGLNSSKRTYSKKKVTLKKRWIRWYITIQPSPQSIKCSISFSRLRKIVLNCSIANHIFNNSLSPFIASIKPTEKSKIETLYAIGEA